MRRFFVPEVVQASAMDCGPAALHSLLRGFNLPSSYGRLREVCQTDIDGTSIDTLEAAAGQLGLEVEQIVLPPEHALLSEKQTLPAIAITQLANGATHFVLIWRKHGDTVQIMDPAVGRRWIPTSALQRELYQHAVPVPADAWLEFATSAAFQSAISARLESLGVPTREVFPSGVEAAHWRPWATLDAAIRLTASLVKAKAIRGGAEAEGLVRQFQGSPDSIPTHFWTALPCPPSDDSDEPADEQILMRGAVLVKVIGKQKSQAAEPQKDTLRAVRTSRSEHPFLTCLSFLQGCGFWQTSFFLLTPIAIASALLLEVLLFRGIFDIAAELGIAGQRFGAVTALILFSTLILCLELAAFAAGTRLSRLLENAMRMAFLRKLPKLNDRFFQSRLISDMAERCHAVHRLRHMPDLVRQLLHSCCELMATAIGIYWLDPGTGPYLVAILAVIALPSVLLQPALTERDLRARTHAGGLTRFYMDAMAGLTAIRAHVAERTILRQQERLLGEWAHAALRLQRLVVGIEALQGILLMSLVASLLVFHRLQGNEIGRVLLIVYWALNLPAVGREVATVIRQIPYYRNLSARLLEPLGAAEEPSTAPAASTPALTAAPHIQFRCVRAQASGHLILDEIDLDLPPGSHVAVVGRSGAGKSSLAGLLLGWLSPSEGTILIDGAPLQVDQVRQRTAWVDPAVQVWNHSLYENLAYGNENDPAAIGQAIDLALLRGVLESLPEGLQTRLGEGGGLVSGGEGQRVRLARALLRKDARLVILDEPFRGLDREKRRELLARARDHWKQATLLCITHDLSETEAFDRVLVLESGRIAEDGSPRDLLADPLSLYSHLLERERRAKEELWDADWWRRIHLHNGRMLEETNRPREDRRALEAVGNSRGLA